MDLRNMAESGMPYCSSARLIPLADSSEKPSLVSPATDLSMVPMAVFMSTSLFHVDLAVSRSHSLWVFSSMGMILSGRTDTYVLWSSVV